MQEDPLGIPQDRHGSGQQELSEFETSSPWCWASQCSVFGAQYVRPIRGVSGWTPMGSALKGGGFWVSGGSEAHPGTPELAPGESPWPPGT